MDGDEFSAGEEEGDFEEGGGQEEEMVEFVTNGGLLCSYMYIYSCASLSHVSGQVCGYVSQI